MTNSINYSDILDTFFITDECFSPENVGIHITDILIPSTVDAFDFIQKLNEELCGYIKENWKSWTKPTTLEFVLNSKKQVLCLVQPNY